ncbi:alpha/beta hydrolase [uncultured Pseudoteredinibacter sp.]|uniref:lipase family alpha/beta hydrolase n=1 Tax=uncultured Pseudoteredinibacter sp. TaxID=1641701 RepID=UPI00262DE259|nr:alpha/beta hydrolase [uncultured Pseudoteredinibacter sp.]
MIKRLTSFLLALTTSLGAFAASANDPPVNSKAECVILLHGLARSSSSMEKLGLALHKEGYHVVNQGYPSRQAAIESLSQKAISTALERCPQSYKVNFVTHSMGGILVRQYLQENVINELKRVVMLGPPNQGSEVVDKLRNVPGFHFINGDAGLQLGTGALSVPKQLGKANFELGIIAGNKSINLILSSLIPETDDGKVSVRNTKLEGMKDHIEMPVTHPFMMKNSSVIKQVIQFLDKGHFEKHPTQQQ